MKNRLIIILFIVLSITPCEAQLSGKTTLYGKPGFSMISVNDSLPYVTNYGNENFSLEMTKNFNRVFILESWISIEIINIPKGIKFNFGDLEIPMRKSVSIEDYNKLSEKEKKLCIPVHHWGELLGYEYLDRLENSKISFKCKNSTFELEKYDFDIDKQKVIIEWKNLVPCEN